MLSFVVAGALALSTGWAAESSAADAESLRILFDQDALLELVQDEAPGHYEYLVRLQQDDTAAYLTQLHLAGHVLLWDRSDPTITSLTRQIWAADAELRDLVDEREGLRGAERRAIDREIDDAAHTAVDLRLDLLDVRAELHIDRMEQLDATIETMLENYDRQVRRVIRRASR